MIILAAVAWYVSGVASFIYWWSSEYDVTSDQLFTALSLGFPGPFSFLIGYSIHSKSSSPPSIVLFKKRGSK